MSDPIIHLKIQSRQRIIFDSDVRTITAQNEQGTFDILPRHANFICLLKDVLTIITVEGKYQQFMVENGLLRVLENKVEVYLGIKETISL